MLTYLILIIAVFKLLQDLKIHSQRQRIVNFINEKNMLNVKYNGFRSYNVYANDPRYPEYKKEVDELKLKYNQ